MIYTTYEMIQDWRSGKPEARSYFEKNYAPVVRRILARYGVEEAGALDFSELAPMPERQFVAELRQRVLGQAPEAPVANPHEPTAVERRALWLETMGYASEDAARMLRISPETCRRIREKLDGLLPKGRIAPPAGGPQCATAKALLDVIDGRATWQARTAIEEHQRQCWYCVDHFCRLLEAIDLIRTLR